MTEQTNEERIDKKGTGAVKRNWIMEFRFTIIGESDNTICKPDVDDLWDESPLGIAYQNFLRALHADNVKLHEGDEAPPSGRVVHVKKVFDEGPHIKRLQMNMNNIP